MPQETADQLLQGINVLNDELNALELSEIIDSEDVLALIQKRQTLIESLFSDQHSQWRENNVQQLQQLQEDCAQTTNLYQSQLNDIKDKLSKLKRSQKSVKAYGQFKPK